ncbi:MAG: PHP domain-containing protein, partial [Verrucomicrobia bacterium]|nr:PHP domain-containing protein [Verrucomicrobiota bacterium]
MHSTFSDGSMTPEELVAMARQLHLHAIALTDHDGTGGLDLLMAACQESPGLIGIPGVEISCDVKHGTLHMLGYFIDHQDAALQGVLSKIQAGRRERNRQILTALQSQGMDLTWDAVLAQAGEDVVGRPHFAAALVAAGHVKSKPAAFDQLLARGRPAYVERYRLSFEMGIKAIRDAGGVAVLAHPTSLELKPKALRKFVGELRDAGLGGLEAYYSIY